MSNADFLGKTSRLREVLTNTLKATQRRYNASMTSHQRDKHIQWVHTQLGNISEEVTGMDDLMTRCGPELLQSLVTEATNQLKETFKGDEFVGLLSFICGSGGNVHLQVQKIFTKIKIVSGKEQGGQIDMDYRHLLNIFPKATSQPQALIVEGLAGMGKTTLLTLLMKEWLVGGQVSIKGLDKYQLLLRVQCRSPHLTKFTNLLEELLPDASLKYRDLLPRLVKQCRLLVVIDGLDERNSNSYQLVHDLLYQLQHARHCTLLCTTRPEALTDFLHSLPNGYGKHVVELVGIPLDLRADFVSRYFEEINRVTESTHSCQELIEKIEKEKYKEHYRFPLNLAIITWLFFYQPDIINKATTQTELYYHTHILCQSKLDDRLANNDLTKFIRKRTREGKVRAWLPHLYVKIFESLSRNELNLGEEVTEHLRSACDTLGLPDDEILAAFLTMRTTWTPMAILEQYSAPHKGLQEYYGALHVMLTLQINPSISIMDVIMEGLETVDTLQQIPPLSFSPIRRIDAAKKEAEKEQNKPKIPLHLYQNLLRHVAGMLHLYLHPVPDKLALESMELLSKAGVQSKDQWLDLIENIKPSSAVLAAIATHFPVGKDIVIKEGRVHSYSVLLPYLPHKQVKLNVKGDPTPLLSGLTHHTCTNIIVSGDSVNHSVLLTELPPTTVEIATTDDPTPLIPSIGRHTCTKVVVREDLLKYRTFLTQLSSTQVEVAVFGDPTPLLPILPQHTYTNVTVRDDPVNHATFLSHLPKTYVDVVIGGDVPSLAPLVPAVTHHTCFSVKLKQHWHHPLSTSHQPDPFIQAVLSRNGVKMYSGQGSIGIESLASTLTHLSLALPDDNQITQLLPLLHSLNKLVDLRLHVSEAVSPECVTTALPDIHRVHLYLSDLSDGGEERAYTLASRLQPHKKYYDALEFPRCYLSMRSWMEVMVECLSEGGVRVKVMRVPGDPTPQDALITKLVKQKLRGTFIRGGLESWVKQ
ncbi:hypothetical protein Pmani_018237 [Petrolisthes manimaculis]|uniref:NACHT domain-containing protein n=1 Tax=Petrolisthes manimaculis TaxID=1843537 RepID=A0AAE1U8Z2_9EUCA|nr:hypothetical protein Pmani_018237 [Petrolisthes manimaculis]